MEPAISTTAHAETTATTAATRAAATAAAANWLLLLLLQLQVTLSQNAAACLLRLWLVLIEWAFTWLQVCFVKSMLSQLSTCGPAANRSVAYWYK